MINEAHINNHNHFFENWIKVVIKKTARAAALAACDETNPYKPPRYISPDGFVTVFTKWPISSL